MTQGPPRELPVFDSSLLHLVARLVPVGDREEWGRAWQAELWHMRHPRHKGGRPSRRGIADLAAGLVLDGWWLRVESWRRKFSGTAFLCLSTLFSLNVLSGLGILLLESSWRFGTAPLAADFQDCLVASPLVLLVALMTNSNRHLEQSTRRGLRLSLRFFFFAQVAEVLLLAFLLSASLCLPIHRTFPNISDLLQMLCFVCLALMSLRWAIRDQEQRCKQCLRSLTKPTRIGRPSHNLLEWNGMELMCKNGHGQLSVPEIETSWCQSSEWIDLNVA
ncbi:hypothetical protein HDF16_002737 [Granulicella aggregans]|uniref:Uncharacterized protein n=1 Tax=Granulicella aggregans TaxID=474949 RepID=A0A7W7ZES9_9BACT|nr:hypothetical protein [Granulicella aggregans]MBB5058031.1 hypothetical protein [Granulicella aggregans]